MKDTTKVIKPTTEQHVGYMICFLVTIIAFIKYSNSFHFIFYISINRKKVSVTNSSHALVKMD
jgi:hypothetical protein